MKTLYFDCFSGISGDMTLAALVDLGADRSFIAAEIQKLAPENTKLDLCWDSCIKQGISALQFHLKPPYPEFHHHSYLKIKQLIESAGFSKTVEQRALEIFRIIAESEAKIHHVEMNKVHFHEVGAIDSIVDIIGVSLALESLDIERFISSRVSLGSGQVECQHGTYPVPAAATLEILKNVPVTGSGINTELTTPTGAGILKALVNEFREDLPPIQVEKIGYGAGQKDLVGRPNVLRVILGDS